MKYLSLMGRSLLTAVAVVAGAGLSTGADDPPKSALKGAKVQTVDVGGLTFEAPSTWEASTPKSTMRKAQLTLPKSAEDASAPELVVFVFPEGAGTVEANVERWQNQFKDGDGNVPKVESKTVKGKNVDVTRVEVAGSYTDPFSKAGTQAKSRLLGGIVETRDAAYFLKLVGPEKSMQAAKADFDKLLGSIRSKVAPAAKK